MRAPAEVQFAQRLAANTKSDRDKAVKKLKKWMYARSSGTNPFQEDEMMKIWKGLFYCYWMSDKPLVQEELAINISSMIDSFSNESNSLLFIKCCVRTMGREWFGIDKWRMDKFMMFVRRFIRQMFRFNAAGDWAEDLTEKLSTLLADTLLLCNINLTSLGLQMHVTDIFLEELAKVGGEDLDEGVLKIYLKPFLKIVSEGRETRLRDHVVERIFHHLIRQSDPGIQWEADQDVKEMGHVEVLEDEEDEEQDDEDGEDLDIDELKLEEDPRAGRVDVELAQLNLDYAGMSDQLFKLGAKESTMKANQSILNALSKMFKDVSNDVYPLGEDTSDVDEPVEKINVGAALEKLTEKQEKIKRKNEKSKEEYRKWKKEQEQAEREAMKLQQQQEAEEADELVEENSDDDANDLKRKLEDDIEDEEEEETPEAKKARIEENKEKKKERERKRKQDMKRKKREKMLADKIKENEARRQSDLLLQQDMELKTALDPEPSEQDSEPRVKKVKKTKKEKRAEKLQKQPLNGHAPELTQPVEKSSSVPKPVEKPSELKDNSTSDLNTSKKKKNKKEKVKEVEAEEVKSTKKIEVKITEIEKPEKSKKKKKKEKNKAKAENEPLAENSSLPTNSSPAKQKPTNSSPATQKPDTPSEGDLNSTQQDSSVSDKKKKKKKDKKKDKLNAVAASQSAEPEKESTETVAKDEESTKKKRKKDKGIKGKLFDESADWDSEEEPAPDATASPVKPVLKPVSTGFAGFDPPTVSTPTLSTTAGFIKKAMSKSATPKKKKGGRLEELKSKELSSSEPRGSKRVNFQLTRNMSQDIGELMKTIANSPGIPHDPAREPEKGLLKKTVSKVKNNGHMQPLQLNTQLNAASPRSNQFIEKKMRMMQNLSFPASSKLIGKKKKKHQ